MARKVLIQVRRGLEKDIGTLAVGELGYCEDTKKLYIGTATGNVLLVAAQTVGDMLKTIYDTNNDGKVDMAEVADNVPWDGVTNKPSTFPPSNHKHRKSEITDFPTAMTPEYNPIPSGADLNDFTEIGFYGTANNSIGNTIVNSPVSEGFSLIIVKRGEYTNQMIINWDPGSPYVWIRSYSNVGGWGEWYKVPFERDIPTKLSQLKGPLTCDQLRGV